MKTTITINGTHCKACKALIENVCGDFKEITSCSVDYETGKTDIEHTEQLQWDDFKKEIENVGGYTVELPR